MGRRVPFRSDMTRSGLKWIRQAPWLEAEAAFALFSASVHYSGYSARMHDLQHAASDGTGFGAIYGMN